MYSYDVREDDIDVIKLSHDWKWKIALMHLKDIQNIQAHPHPVDLIIYFDSTFQMGLKWNASFLSMGFRPENPDVWTHFIICEHVSLMHNPHSCLKTKMKKSENTLWKSKDQ